MLDFNFYNPTQIVFGKDRIGELDNLIPKDARVLVTFGGGSVVKFGTLDKVKNALGERFFVEFGGIEPNPQFNTLIKALDVIKENNIDFLLAVGGGSVLDGTKFINIAYNYEKDNKEELLYTGFGGAPITKALDFGTVLTLPATGSEMNSGGVISHETGKFSVGSPLVFPKFSILDPTVTYTLPDTQVANGIIDTFVHVNEQYLTCDVNSPLQDRISESILKTLLEEGPKTFKNKTDYEARANFMWSATLALNGLISAGVMSDWSTHMIGHELTYLYGIDHGKSLAIVHPSLLDVRREKKKVKLVQFAERVFDIKEGTDDEKITKAIECMKNFFESFGVSTKLSDYGVCEDGVKKIVKELENHGMDKLSETGDLTLEISEEILMKSL